MEFSFPTLNASLNALAGILLLVGFYFIKKRNFAAHQKVMWSAFAVSTVFLISYLYYHATYPETKFAGVGIVRPIYFAILISHVLLAVTVPPFALRLLWLSSSSKGSLPKHARMARWVWPLWMYVSVTGVIVYIMLYRLYPAAGLST